MRKSGRRARLAAPAAAAALLLLALNLLGPAAARAQWTTPDSGGNTSTTHPGNVGIGTATPAYPLTISKSVNGPVVTAVFNTADGAGAQVGAVVSRTTDFSGKYLSWGVTAPSFSLTGYGETAYFHSAGVPLKFGSNTAHDLHFFTDGIANTRMTITGGGNVGVGTTSPITRLHVAGGGGIFQGDGASAGGLVQFWKDAAPTRATSLGMSVPGTALTDDFVFSRYANTSGWSESMRIQHSTGNVGIGTPNPTHTLEVNGTIHASQAITGATIHATYQDVAEWVPSAQKLTAGTVVILDAARTNHVVASAGAYDTKVAGVVSAEPGVILGVAGDGKVKVATTGRVRVKVDASRGAIRVGDLLVTSGVEGVAMRSVPVDLGGTQIHRPGTIIGKALEPLEKGAGEILVLLSLQ